MFSDVKLVLKALMSSLDDVLFSPHDERRPPGCFFSAGEVAHQITKDYIAIQSMDAFIIISLIYNSFQGRGMRLGCLGKGEEGLRESASHMILGLKNLVFWRVNHNKK